MPERTEPLAFPTAYGAGAYSRGGTGGIIVHVTNLNSTGVGSLAWALTDPAHSTQKKTIVFDVSGVISLEGTINMSIPEKGGDYAHGLTIAGQTAPLGGVTVTHGKLRFFGVNDMIVRYMKFREGDYATDGCLSNSNGSNVIFDHLSGSHTPDIVFSLTSSDEVSDSKTIQHCLLAQSKNGLIIGDTTPIDPPLTYFEQASILRNAYYNVGWRVPLKGGSRIRVDAINNIAHNWSARLTRMDGFAYELNHIGNYYQGGYNTTNVLKHCSYLSSSGDPKIYNHDNYMDPDETTPEYLTDESVVWTEFQNNFVPLPSSYFTDTQNPIRGRAIPILSSSELKAVVLPEVGACRYIKDDGTAGFYRDTYDTTYINGIDTDDNSSRSTVLGTIVTLSNTRPVNYYVSNPHIPEVYLDRREADLTAEGVTKTDPDVHNTVMPSGYTLFEDFINQVDENAPIVNIPVITLIGASTINLDIGEIYVELGATASDVEDGDLTNNIVIDSSNVNINTEGVYQVTYNVSDSDGNDSLEVTRTIVVGDAVPDNIFYPLTKSHELESKKSLIQLVKN